MGYKRSATLDTALDALEAAFPQNCARFGFGRHTHEGRPVTGLEIVSNSQASIPVLFTGGVHPRELAPPDALLSFCEQMLVSLDSGADVVLASFTDSSGVTYDSHTIPASTVRSIFERCDIYVMPCVNPDGRDFVLASGAMTNMMWRKNRRPDPAGCIGVDVNRNFPIAWDADVYYAPNTVPTVHTSTNPCNETFRGYTAVPPPGTPNTEPETQNLIDLIDSRRFNYFVDVHMYGRTILWPWGMEEDQSVDTTQNFTNTAFDGARDGIGGTYSEYIPDSLVDVRGQLLQRLQFLAGTMAFEIGTAAGFDPTAIQRSIYKPGQSIGLYPTTGAIDDYTFSRQFIDTALDNVHAFTIEAGQLRSPSDPDDDDGGFWPDSTTQFPKVEREIHAALYGLLKNV
jgi:hypothetical protein